MGPPRPLPVLPREYWLGCGQEGAADLRPVEGGPLRRAGRAVAGFQYWGARLRVITVPMVIREKA